MPPNDERPTPRRRALSEDDYVAGVLAKDRAVLGRAISLVESNARAHQALAQRVLTRLLPHTGKARRVGISGVPGVGKSTFIEKLGSFLTARDHHVAVLAVDPSSERTKGSILGDKTRMVNLAQDKRAFIRPSPSSGSLGGVGRKTRETILLCEAAGFDVVLVETVGVGQSETMVADMVDFYLVLMLAGAGDELQGIKRGILEMADLIAVNKADAGNEKAAERARREYASALELMHGRDPAWRVPVVKCSGLTGTGLDALWAEVEKHRAQGEQSGALEERRKEQLLNWMWRMVQDELFATLKNHAEVRALVPQLERDVHDGKLTATLAAQRILSAFSSEFPPPPGEGQGEGAPSQP